MQKYLIALDLDGTLLNDEKIITDRTLRTLNYLKEQGHVIVIATGRPYRVSKQYYAQLNLDTPIVNMNGAYIHHPRNKNWKEIHNPMPINVAMDIIDTSYEVGVQNIMAEVIDQVYVDRDDNNPLVEYFIGGLEQQAIIGELRNTLQDNPSSMLIHPFEDRVDLIRNTIDKRHATVVDYRKWGAPFNVIEIVKSGMHKAFGLQIIAKEYGIPQERIIAFGDEDNDLEMIEYAGIGVAMGNGIDPLKNIAKEITITNTEDGVAYFLEQYFNLSNETLKTKEY